MFYKFVAAFEINHSYTQPLLIGETGGCPAVNATFINNAVSNLTNPTGNYTSIRAFLYWDAAGSYACPVDLNDSGPWVFTDGIYPEDNNGLAAFKTMGQLSYFNPTINIH